MAEYEVLIAVPEWIPEDKVGEVLARTLEDIGFVVLEVEPQ